MMPYEHFKNMSDEDLAAVVVYIRSMSRSITSYQKPKLSFR